MTGILIRLRESAARLARRKDGAAAVEFALIVPIMLTMYFGTMEISQGLEVNKKAGRASSLIGDLVTQQAVITKAEVIAIAGLAEATLQPYSRDIPVVEVVGIQITDEPVPKARVVWSQRVVNGAGGAFLPVGSIISIPGELMIRNTFIVRGGMSVNYYPVTTYSVDLTAGGQTGVEMGEVYHLRPRTSPTVACADCV